MIKQTDIKIMHIITNYFNYEPTQHHDELT